ncbi:AGAP000443-PA-like protein [Anopheles sinensis]|uniref:AGAP000443-PA-like protein n=1 Tax=Anopheles sinensis TaxID=74873 RepID=A0A084VX64_ANOSI|nr:AGAP000443-PA-like protein [Anopheles sinensis]
MTSYVVYELIYTMVLLEECSLFLKHGQGTIASHQLPSSFQDCSVTFPSQRTDEPEELPGLLVQLTRLNTPCRAGGFLRFIPDPSQRGVNQRTTPSNNAHQIISLCGKLEELPASERSFHFQPHRNTTLHLHNQPLFSLQYRLVDFCYNMTLQDQNGTVQLGPSRSSLDCYFKIHLRTNDWQLQEAAHNGSGAGARYEPIELNALETVLAGQQLTEPVRCSSAGGMLIELYEDSLRRWTSCINGSTTPARYSLLSSSNNLVIKVTKLPLLGMTPWDTPADINRGGRWRADPASSSSSSSPTSTTPSVEQLGSGPSSPSLLFEYRAHPIEPITSRCAFGWIATAQFCISSIERRLPWQEAELECNQLGGHLVSIRSSEDQQLIDQLLFNSPGYKDDNAYWIGASDLVVEGDFRWNDKFSFSYTNWFQGWVHQEHYNRQPNDDGLSGQDCVEIRRHFQIASSSGQTTPTMSPLTMSYMWNDRNCDARNYFICERMMDEELPERLWNEAECNVTVTLSSERSKTTIWSPGFPQMYPDSVDCYTLILAPPGYRVVLDFEEMVLENEPLCYYDYLQLVEPDGDGPYVSPKVSSSNTVQFRFRNSRHSGRNSVQHRRKSSKQGGTTALPTTGSGSNGDGASHPDRRGDINFNVPSIVLQPNDSRYTSSLPLPELSLGSVPRKICGDWSTKLKLLRYVTNGPTLGLRFVSDYSNSYGGYKAKISMENVTSECHDERFKAYNNSCYLIISYPDVDWTTAQQICRGIGAQLASISTTDEQRFITSNIRNSIDYTPRSLYWVGGEITTNGNLEWVDGVKLLFEVCRRWLYESMGWLPGQRPEPSDTLKLPSCLGLQWKVSPTPMISSGLHWTAQKCSMIGGYVCKKPRPKLDETMVKNQTLTGTEGHILSPGYPNPYPAQTDFWIRIVAPEHNRIIIQFQKLDLEHQDECLYDYISIQNYPIVPSSPAAFFGASESSGMALVAEVYHGAPNGSSGATPVNKKQTNFEAFPSTSNARPTEAPITTGRQIRGPRRRIRYVSSSGAEYGLSDQDGATREKANGMAPTLLASSNVNHNELHPSFLPYVRWCGSHDVNMARFNFISTGNEAIVRFHSDFSISGAGFSATWSTVDISGCPLQTITSKEGSIRSPNYPYFLLNNLDCTYVIQAPYGRRVWLEFLVTDLAYEATLQVDIADGPFEPFADESHVNDGVFVSNGERLVVRLKTGAMPRGKGFQAVFKTLAHVNEQRYLMLSNKTTGMLYSLNYPQTMPYGVDYTQHLIAPLGEVILLELYGVGFSQHGCHQTGFIEIYDNYTDSNGTLWHLCEHHVGGKPGSSPDDLEDAGRAENADGHYHPLGHGAAALRDATGSSHPALTKPAPIYITSYLNTIHIRQRNINGTGIRLNATVRLQEDAGYKMKLISNADEWVESCKPNPCQYGGKCITSHKRGLCQCYGHFTGRFCGLNICELEPCFFGKCELTPNSFKCNCQPGFVGQRCDQRQKPCAENPCESRGECFEKNGGFFCRCHAWWEGPRCEKRMMHIPYKPLSERMLQEPFWLGLITVFVVLAVIGLVWCAKRHFPEKIEKLLADETQINRSTFPPHHLNTALREQLQASAGTVPSSNATTPASHRTIFGRLGTPSPRKKRNNSTPTKKNVNEKKQILQQLVSPAQNAATKVISLGELIQLSETRLKAQSYADAEAAGLKETTFSENSLSVTSMVRQISDPKLEKKVTFARLLSKVSAEMSSGSEDLANGSDSLSSSELALHDFGLRSNARRQRPKVSSADSILAMFKNFAASSSALNTLPSSIVISPSSTPTASSPQDDVPGDDDSSTSSNQNTPVSYSSGGGASDSPVFYRQSTIEVPVLDALSAHKSTPTAMAGGGGGSGGGGGGSSGSGSSSGGSGQLHPPTILLEIPSNGINNKCLSPIREMPTPIPSPALTPIMPRPQRSIRSPQMLHDESMSVTFNASFDEYHKPHQLSIEIRPPSPPEDAGRCDYSSSSQSDTTVDGAPTGPTVSIDIHPPTPEHRSPERPRDLIIPELIIQQPSPTRERTMVVIFPPGSPPPQRANQHPFDTGLPSPYTTTDKQQYHQKRFLKQWEKPTSLDLPFDPPMITITSNSNEVVSDAEAPSPAHPMGHPKQAGLGPPGSGGAAGMCYLSPFSMCIRGDRAPSESNLSSSGYSSMASPGPSRCGSSNPLFPHESDEPGSGPAGGPGYSGFHSLINNRRQSSSNVRKKSADSGATGGGGGGGTTVGPATGFSHHHHSFRLRSDSETLSDEPLLESNDEGIGTDHLDEKIEEGEIRSAKELELYLGKELIQSGQDILSQENLSMSQLQLPSIVIQSDAGCDKLSPVSSRSDSPLSERNASLERFSTMFYGKKDQHLPFTDSDGLYDFPSSDGKGAGGVVGTSSHRKSAGRRKERRVARSTVSLQSPSKATSPLLELPGSAKFPSTAPTARKSPKRRVHRQPLASSSSSTESLTSMRENATRTIKGIHHYSGRDPCGVAHLSASKVSADVCDYGDDTGEVGRAMSNAKSKQGREP